MDIIDIYHPAKPVELGFGILPDYWSFFPDAYDGAYHSYNLVDGYLYWFIGNPPIQPVIETFDLSGL